MLESWWSTFSSVSGDPAFILLTGLASLIGVPLAIYFYLKSRRFKQLAYSFKSTSFVRDYQSKIPDLELFYKGSKVPNITLTRFVFWNSGRETINETDVAKTDELKLEIAEPAVLLNAEIIPPVRDANILTIQTSNDKKSIDLSFEFLDVGDGVVFEVLHTSGRRDKDFSILGTIKGAKPLQYYARTRVPLTKGERIASVIFYLMVPILCIAGAVLLPSARTPFLLIAVIPMTAATGFLVELIQDKKFRTIPERLKHDSNSI